MAIGETYEQFVNKFKPKKTTDDCMTPPKVYEVVKNWACNEYGINPSQIVRPFWPGGDYTAVHYPPSAVVLDNPPFSILSKIIDYFTKHEINYFLFEPALVAFSKNCGKVHHVMVDAPIEYENGAKVATSFCTNLEPALLRTAPELDKQIKEVCQKLRKTKQPPKYSYPENVVTASMLKYMSKGGVDFRVNESDAHFVRALDAQRKKKKGIFGGGYLISEKAAAEKAAAEKAAAEKAAAEKWQLSEREKEIIKNLGK